MSEQRLHKFIASCGICSRRKAEEMIAEGRVTVNDSIVIVPGTKVTEGDRVEVDGKRIEPSRQYVAILNKPKGVVTTMSDPHGRQTVADLMPKLGATLKPAGRLDRDTEGLLILTNDGDLAMRLTHPRYSVEKEYIAEVRGMPAPAALQKLRKGVRVEGKRTAPAKVDLISTDEERDRATLRIVIHEGRKRQVRLMCDVIRHGVVSLRRVRIGPVTLKGLTSGQVRLMGKQEIDRLRRTVGLS